VAPLVALGKDILGSAAPKVGAIEITDTSPTSISLRASVNITNPTPYSARIPFISIYVENNGTTIGEAFAENLDVKPGNNTNLSVSAVWNPSMGGEKGIQRGRDLLSEYISGYNTTVTVRTHRGSGSPAVETATMETTQTTTAHRRISSATRHSTSCPPRRRSPWSPP
jgi:hypothetical protein